MDAISYSKARAELAKTMDRACDDHEAIIVTRRSGKNVVIISKDDYDSLSETAFLKRNSEEAARLTRAMEEMDEIDWEKTFDGVDERVARDRKLGEDAA